MIDPWHGWGRITTDKRYWPLLESHPPRVLPALIRLLTHPSVFAKEATDANENARRDS